jgi:hypothetical protein
MSNTRKPNLWANPTNRTAKLWNLTWDQVLAVDGAVWKSIVGGLVAIFVMTLFNKWDWRGVNIVFAILGYLYIWWAGLKPTHLAYSGAAGGIFAALFDQDKSQGVGGGPRILFNVVQSIAYTFLLISFTLITWDFSESVASFWVVALGVIIVTQTGDHGKWRNRIILSYTVVCILAALWMTFGGSWRGEAFDPATGQALHMVDPVTNNIDSQERSPADCQPLDGSSDFATKGRCFSAETCNRLVPMGAEQAIRRNPVTAPGSFASDAASAIGGMIGNDVPECRNTVPTVIHNTRLTVPVGCEMPVDTTRLRDGNWEIEFADESLPLVNGERQLNGKSIQDFISYSWVNTGAGRNGMKLLTNDTAFEEAGITYVEIIFLPKGATAARIDLTPAT